MASAKSKLYILISFSLIFGWIMSFPYEGPVMYALAGENGINGVLLNMFTVFFHFAGLFVGRFLSKDIKGAKIWLLICIGTTLFISLFIPFINADLWLVIIPSVSFLTGISISLYGHMLKGYFRSDERKKTVADILIYGNIVLISAHIFANDIKPILSFVLIQVLLFIALIMIYKINITECNIPEKVISENKSKGTIKAYWILFLFIFIITINSGIMFQVIYPYFYEFEVLVSIYTNIPYILAIFILSRLFSKNKFYFLYVGLSLWIVTFILFASLGKTPLSFVLICSVMLFACGIFDYFWWSVMANIFDYVENPASIFGLGLSLNVLGVWIGGLIGNYFLSIGIDKEGMAYLGILIVVISMLIILPLNSRLSDTIIHNQFLVRISYKDENDIKEFILEMEKLLSRREVDVFRLLIEGKTDTEISKKLYISPHTIKTHNRNIYKKIGVANRIELIEKITKPQ